MGMHIDSNHRQKGEHPYALDSLASRGWLAPHPTKPNHERRDHHNADAVGQEPGAPSIPKWRRRYGVRSLSRRLRSAEAAAARPAAARKPATRRRSAKRKRPPKPALAAARPPGQARQHCKIPLNIEVKRPLSLMRLAATVPTHHANHKRRARAPTRYDQNAGSDAGCGPEHGHVGGLRQQGEPKLGRQKIDDREGTGPTQHSHPPPSRRKA